MPGRRFYSGSELEIPPGLPTGGAFMNVEQTEHQIAQLLAKLERESGQLVRSISVNAIEITNIDDARPVHQMRVCIELERLPGHQW